jgi:hypothetical protein
MKIEIRRGQHKDEAGNNVIVQCNNISGQFVAEYVPGSVPTTWTDITDYVNNLKSIELTLKMGDGGTLIRDKSTSTSLEVVSDAKVQIMNWLTSTPCSELNWFDVRITDDCGIELIGYEIRPDNIEVSEYEAECAINFPLVEANRDKSFLDIVSIFDDWQGWFSGGKDFDTHEVCIHNTPIQHGINIGLIMFIQGFGTIPIINVGFGSIVSGFLNLGEARVENMGFGKFLACPKIYEIIDNFCAKHGWTADTPFHNQFENDAIVAPYAGDFMTRLDGSCTAPDTKFSFNNVFVNSATDFLAELCKVYNMQYELNTSTQTLVLRLKKDTPNTVFTFNFNEDDVIEHKKTFNSDKRKAAIGYLYTMDSGDQKSNTMQRAYNDYVSTSGGVVNPLFSGKEDRRNYFAPVGFWGDGFGLDYLNDIPNMGRLISATLCAILNVYAAIQVISYTFPAAGAGVGAVVVTFPAQLVIWGLVASGALLGLVNSFIYASDIKDQFAYETSCHQGAIQLYGTGQKSNLSIIRLQAGKPMNEAKVIIDPVGNIQKNPKYNKPNIDWVNQWQTGYQKLNVFNYDLYFDSYYLGNLYPELHEQTDNYQFRNSNNSLREITLVACCNYLQFFGFDNENNRKEGRVIQWTYKGITYKGQVKEVIKKEYELTIKVKEFR